jgi:hypothetical protein
MTVSTLFVLKQKLFNKLLWVPIITHNAKSKVDLAARLVSVVLPTARSEISPCRFSVTYLLLTQKQIHFSGGKFLIEMRICFSALDSRNSVEFAPGTY